LEGICEPGGVLISGTAFDHLRGRIDANLVDLGEKDLKNIARPVRVYAVKIGAESMARPAPSASAPDRQGAAAPLDGRVLPFANIGGDPVRNFTSTNDRAAPQEKSGPPSATRPSARPNLYATRCR
jgi:hypothetical protein